MNNIIIAFILILILLRYLIICNYFYELVIFTTFIFNKNISINRTFIQHIVYKSLLSITNNNSLIKVIIYIENNIQVNFYKSVNIIIINIPKYNMYGTPYFGFLIENSIKKFKSNYYMYINGDIIITPYISEIIMTLNKYKMKGFIKNQLLCVATRNTIYYDSILIYNSNIHYLLYKRGAKSSSYSQDVFLMSETTYKINSNIFNHLLIGRAGIDNIILGIALNNSNNYVIDATKSIAAIHLEECRKCKKKFITVLLYIIII